MFLLLLIAGCLPFTRTAISPDGESSEESLTEYTGYFQKWVNFINVVYYSIPLQFSCNLGELEKLPTNATVEVGTPLLLMPSGRVSYLNNTTKECTIEVKSEKGIRINDVKGETLLTLSDCHIDLKWRLESRSGWTISTKAFEVFSCGRIEDGDGAEPLWAPRVPGVLSRALTEAAAGRHYSNATDSPLSQLKDFNTTLVSALLML